MKTAPVVLVAALLLLAACAANEKENPSFADRTWEGAKQTTDQVAGETVDAMKKAGDKGNGFFDNLWK
jgi:major membrane immunogen (membrane-anchored lipoprotein)